MERHYPHRPDTAYLRRRLDRAPRGLGNVETTLGEGRGDLYIVDAGVDEAWEAAATRWLFGQSPAEALELFPRGSAIVGIGLEQFPGSVHPGAAERWLVLMSAAVLRGLTATPGLPDVPAELIR